MFVLFILLSASFLYAQASPVVNEVLYDPVGANGGNQLIEIKNIGDATADIGGWWFCHRFSYTQIPTGVTIPAGGIIVIHVGKSGTNTSTDIFISSMGSLNASASDLSFYSNSSFSNPSSIRDFVQWGSSGNGRESVAVSAGIWTAGDFVTNVAEGHSIEYDGDGNSSADWSDQPEPTIGQENGVVTPAPSISVQPDSLDYGDVFLGSSSDLNITVSNIGDSTLIVSDINSSSAAFTLPDTSFSLQPDSSRLVNVTFTPDSVGLFTGNLTIFSNDPVDSAVSVLLFGSGIVVAIQNFSKITSGDIVNDGGNSDVSLWGDYDNDGYIDLFVANFLENNFLYKNNGDGTFTKIIEGDIVSDGGNSQGGSWGDYNNDGFLDLYVVNPTKGNALYRNNGDGTFNKITENALVTDTLFTGSANWGDYDNDGFLDLFVSVWSDMDNILYRNNGDETFTKLTDGDLVNDGGTSGAGNWGDYDNDGYLDLFVPNASFQNNFLYRNNGNGTFLKITVGDIVNDGGNSAGSSWGDYDNDGDLDLFVANPNEVNFLYRNNGDGTFTKITEGDIVNIVETWEASGWGDYDNDGDLDLFVANAAGSNNFNYLYQNNGDGTFTTITGATLLTDNNQAISGAWGDYDNDGFLDLFVARAQGLNNLLFQNDGNGNNWINIKLVGVVSNTSAIGAIVKAKATIDGKPTWQMRQVSGQTGYRTQNSLNAEFGFRDAVTVDSILIKWPSGRIQVLENLAINQFLEVVEDSTIVGIEHDLRYIPTEFSLEQNYPNPFNPVTTISFALPVAGNISLIIYDLNGWEIMRWDEEVPQGGYYQKQWNGKNLNGGQVSSGVYLYRLIAGDFVQTRKMVLLK